MDCPSCTHPMIVLELNQVEVDHCTRCGGVWLDAEEMDLLLEGSAGREEIRARTVPDPDHHERELRCPICSKRMEKARVGREAPAASLRIDRCYSAHGTWLDGGELHQIVAMSEFPAAHRVHEFLSAIFRGADSR